MKPPQPNRTDLRGDQPGASAQAAARKSRRFAWAVVSALFIALAFVLPKLLVRTVPLPSTRDRTVNARDTASIPEAKFTDITASAGIRFIHRNGASGDKLLPETMGGGVAFFDFDNDGDADLLFINSADWPGQSTPGKATATHALCRNDGKGNFTDVTSGSGLDVSFYGMGVACGDYDNDGFVDVFITGVGGNRLFKNMGGGKFTEMTRESGVGGPADAWSTSAAWVDYDNDGRLDLFVCHYVQWSRELDFQVNYTLPGIGRAYGPPMNFPGSFPLLYRNEGNGRFADVSAKTGIQVTKPGTAAPMAKSLGVAPIDLDSDGWIDLIVANDTVPNFVFHNERNGSFKEIGGTAGLAYGPFGGARGAMGIDASPIQDENDLAVAIGNFANEMTALYVSSGSSLLFTDEAIRQGIGDASRLLLTFGVFFFDYDLDGWSDLLTVNGHVEDQIQRVQPAQSYRQPAQLFWNARGAGPSGGFLPVPPEKCGSDLLQPVVGRGSAFADIDGDGDLDVVFTQNNGSPVLLRNDQKVGHHWLRLKLEGAPGNRDSIGARVKVRIAGKTISRQVMPTRGYLSQSELPVTIGLGNAARVDEVEVTWPGGMKEKVAGARLDSVNTVRQTAR